MSTSKVEPFAVWLTGLPASGKSTIARALKSALGPGVALLESNELRRVLTPRPTYSPEERDAFYAAIVHVAGLLVDHGVPVIIDATGHRRAYRDAARRRIGRFLEVFVDCPVDVCAARDPKGLYHGAAAARLPGVGVPYEPPERPDLVVHGRAGAVARIIERLGELPAAGCDKSRRTTARTRAKPRARRLQRSRRSRRRAGGRLSGPRGATGCVRGFRGRGGGRV